MSIRVKDLSGLARAYGDKGIKRNSNLTNDQKLRYSIKHAKNTMSPISVITSTNSTTLLNAQRKNLRYSFKAKKNKGVPGELETNPYILEKREKQILQRKSDPNYRNYILNVPKNKRSEKMARTPDRMIAYSSTKEFDELVKNWTLKFHAWTRANDKIVAKQLSIGKDSSIQSILLEPLLRRLRIENDDDLKKACFAVEIINSKIQEYGLLKKYDDTTENQIFYNPLHTKTDTLNCCNLNSENLSRERKQNSSSLSDQANAKLPAYFHHTIQNDLLRQQNIDKPSHEKSDNNRNKSNTVYRSSANISEICTSHSGNVEGGSSDKARKLVDLHDPCYTEHRTYNKPSSGPQSINQMANFYDTDTKRKDTRTRYANNGYIEERYTHSSKERDYNIWPQYGKRSTVIDQRVRQENEYK